MRRRARTLGRAGACLVVAAVAATGCGGGKPRSTGTTAAGERPTLPVRIRAPRPDAVLTATRRAGSRPVLALDVAGSADSAQTIHVDARCPERACSTFVYSDGAGEWRARLRLPVTASRRRLTITAGYPTTEREAARVRITVRVPRPRAAQRRSSARGRARRRSLAPTGTTPAATLPTQPQGPSASAPVSPPARTQTTPGAGGGGRGALVLVGDSLAVGVRGLLPSLLPGWRVSVDGRIGRPLAEGLRVLEATPVPSGGVLGISLFTNDDPTHTSQLQAAIRETLARAGPRGCVIWATIVRPPVNGVSYQAANAVMERAAAADSRLRVVPWAAQVAARPSLIGADGVHPTPAGYRLRAELYAGAAQSC
jgi:hypothetical protein